MTPLALLTLAFCLGIFSACFIKISLWFIYFFAFILIIFIFLWIKKGLIPDICFLGLSFLLGVISLQAHDRLPASHITNYVYFPGKQTYTIKGIVTSEPQLNSNRTTFTLQALAINTGLFSRYCCGNILVQSRGRKKLGYGEVLLLRGNLYRPFGGRDSYRKYLYNQGIYLVMSVKSSADIIVFNENNGFLIKKFALCLKDKIEGIFSRFLRPASAAIVEAMVLGERKNIPVMVVNSMVKLGTVHILVVSGFNVGIVAFIAVMLLKLLRVPKKPRIALAIILLIIYCFATGASNPVVRATIMAIVFLLAAFLKREADIYHSLSIAALFILGQNPRQLFDIGFQLSFASVISITCLYPKIKTFLHLGTLRPKCIRYIADGFSVSFSAWAGTMGLVAYYFGIFSPISVFANIFIVPLATLITLCGFSLALSSLILPALTPFFALSTELIVVVLLQINALLIKLPGAYFYL